MFLNIKSNFPPGIKIDANWMGWFRGADGKNHAANVCQSDDPRTIRNQVLAASSIGIDSFVVDWYGGGVSDRANPTDNATLLLAPACAQVGMEFSIMLDKGAFKNSPNKLTALNTAMQYVRAKYFTQPNYTKLNGKFLLWEFGWKENGIDISSWAKANPDVALVSQNNCPIGATGSYAWVNGFAPNSSPQNYMDFYLKRNDPEMIPCIFDGFDDHDPINTTQSRWGGPARHIPYGQWQVCIDAINKAIASGKKFKRIQICTWNDYDERTQIESQALALEGLRLY